MIINLEKSKKYFFFLLYTFFLFYSINCKATSERETKKPINYEIIYEKYMNGDASGALREIENIDSNDHEILELAGNIHYEKANIPEAIHYYNRALFLKKSEALYLRLVSCFLYQRNKEEAIRTLKILNEGNQGEPHYSFLIGVLYKQLNEFRNAMIFFAYSLNRGFEPKEDVYNQILYIKNSIQDERLIIEFEKYFKDAEKIDNFQDSTIEISKIEIEVGKKKYKNAIEILKELLRKKPENIDLISILAELYFLDNQYTESYSEFKKLKKINPESLDAGLGIVRTLLKLNNLDEAYKEIKNLEKKFNGNPEFHTINSQFYEFKKDYLKAQHELLKIGSLDLLEPEKIIKLGDLYLMRAMPEQALNLYYKLESKIDKNLYKKKLKLAKSHLYVNEFLKLLNFGDLIKAGESIEKAREVDLNLKSEFFYSYYLSKIGKNEESSLLFNNIYSKYNYYPAIILANQTNNEIKKIDENLSSQRIEELHELSEFYEFIGEYEKVIEVWNNPENPKPGRERLVRSIYNLAKRELKKGNLEKVFEYSNRLKNLKAFDEYTELEKKIPLKLISKSGEKNENQLNTYKKIFSSSGSVSILKKIFEIYVNLSEIEKALVFIKENEYINSPEYLEVLVEFYISTGFYSTAVTLSLEIESSYPESAIPKVVIGKLKLIEKNSNAIDYFQKALDINPGYTPAVMGMGLYYFDKKEYNKAETYFKFILEQDKFDIEALHQLALIEYHKGNSINSEYLIEEVLKIRDNYLPALFLKSKILFSKNNYDESKLLIEKILKISENIDYLKFYKKILNKMNLSKEYTQKVEEKILQKLEYDNHISEKISIQSVHLQNIIQPEIPPIKINKNYLFIGKETSILYDGNFKNVIWKNDLLRNIKNIKFIGIKDIYLTSLNELFRVDLQSGRILWKIELLENDSTDLFVKDFIYYSIKKDNQDFYIYIIDSNGKLIKKLEIKKSNKIFLDEKGNIYSVFISERSLELQIFYDHGKSRILKTLFLPQKTYILYSFQYKNSIVLFTENFIYSLDFEGKLALNSHNRNLSKYLLTYKNKSYFLSKKNKVYSFDLDNSGLSIAADILPERRQEHNLDALDKESFLDILRENKIFRDKLKSRDSVIFKIKQENNRSPDLMQVK